MGNLSLDSLLANLPTADAVSGAAAGGNRSADGTSFGDVLQRARQPVARSDDSPTSASRAPDQQERQETQAADSQSTSQPAVESSPPTDRERTETVEESAPEAQPPV